MGELCYRFDVDTRIGASDGVPRLFDVFSRYNASASFYTVLGKEEPYPLVWFQQRVLGRRPAKGLASIARPHKSKIGKKEFIRRIVKPVNFASEQRAVFHRLLDEGFELGCHSVNHEDWALNLPRLEPDKELKQMRLHFKEYFDAEPTGFVAPTFRTDERVLAAMDANGFTVGGDLPGEEPFHPVIAGKKLKHVQVPVNVRCDDTVPLTEHYWKLGYGDVAIAKAVNNAIDEKISQGKPAVIYGHPLLEGTVLLGVVEKVLVHAQRKGYEIVTCGELARKYAKNYRNVQLSPDIP